MNEPHPLNDVRHCLCRSTRRAARALTRAYDTALAPAGLTVSQFSLLAVLASHGPLGVTRLAAELDLDRTTLTRNLKPLVKAGLVETRSGRDARARPVALTRLGRKRFAAARPLWARTQADMVARLEQSGGARDLLARLGAAEAAALNRQASEHG